MVVPLGALRIQLPESSAVPFVVSGCIRRSGLAEDPEVIRKLVVAFDERASVDRFVNRLCINTIQRSQKHDNFAMNQNKLVVCGATLHQKHQVVLHLEHSGHGRFLALSNLLMSEVKQTGMISCLLRRGVPEPAL